MINIINKYEPREFIALNTNEGIILCDKKEGAFLVLRFKEDIERLKAILNKIKIIE